MKRVFRPACVRALGLFKNSAEMVKTRSYGHSDFQSNRGYGYGGGDWDELGDNAAARSHAPEQATARDKKIDELTRLRSGRLDFDDERPTGGGRVETSDDSPKFER